MKKTVLLFIFLLACFAVLKVQGSCISPNTISQTGIAVQLKIDALADQTPEIRVWKGHFTKTPYSNGNTSDPKILAQKSLRFGLFSYAFLLISIPLLWVSYSFGAAFFLTMLPGMIFGIAAIWNSRKFRKHPDKNEAGRRSRVAARWGFFLGLTGALFHPLNYVVFIWVLLATL